MCCGIIKTVAKVLSCNEAMFFLALCSGWEALAGISASCLGFKFLGITLIVIGIVLLILQILGFLVRESKVVVHEEDVYDGNDELDLDTVFTVFASWPLFAVVAALAMFALAVSVSGGGKPIPGRPYKEYRVEWYSKWMQRKVNDAHNWDASYKKAVVRANVCDKFSKEFEFDTLDAIHSRKLTSFESSCCMPPEDCGFNYTSPTVWVKPENGYYTNIDCNRWDNDPNTLCYDCKTCKAAFLQDVTTHYFVSGTILLLPIASRVIPLLCRACMFFTVFGLGTWFGCLPSSPYYNNHLV